MAKTNKKTKLVEFEGKTYKGGYTEVYKKNLKHSTVSLTMFRARVYQGWGIRKALKTKKQWNHKPSKEILDEKLHNIVTKTKPADTDGSLQGGFKEVVREYYPEEQYNAFEKELNKEAPTDTQKPVEEQMLQFTATIAINKKVNPAEKRVTLYVAKAEIEGTKRAVIGFTTEDKPSDLVNLDADILLLSKVGFATAGQIQNKIIEVFFNQHNLEESEVMASSQVFDLREGEYFNALDYIYSLISSYQNSQQEA